MEQISLVVADDHKLFRDGIKKLLELEADIEVVGEASDGIETLEMVRNFGPDILLFDVNLPRLDGLQVVRELNNLHTEVRYVAISAYDDEERLSALSSEGVHGFVLKASGKVELLSAIRSASRGQNYVDPKVAGKLLTSFYRRKEETDQLYELTPREKEILYWLAQGLSNSEISHRMVLSEKTVKNHVSHVLKKLDLRDRTQAAIMAWKVGFAQLNPDSVHKILEISRKTVS
jgi:DNA-binding NarL/FixJ family response regulator